MNKRKLIGWCLAAAFVVTGKRLRKVRAYDKQGKVLALTAHFPDARTIEDVLSWLICRGFTFISTDELLAINEGRKQWRPRLAWLTFDDGWCEVKSEALGVLEKYQVPATIFVAPHESERGQMWTNSVMGEIHYSGVRELFSKPLAEREKVVDGILGHIGNPRRLLTPDELIDLAKHPLITLENHTFSHMSCSHRPIDEMLAEVQKTNEILLRWTGRKPRLMCFPFGHWHAEQDKVVRDLGLWPVSCDAGEMEVSKPGGKRNMFREGFTSLENICRALNAWKKVTVPDK